jgi:hypothetical protein
VTFEKRPEINEVAPCRLAGRTFQAEVTAGRRGEAFVVGAG